MTPQILMYTAGACSYCRRADRLLEEKGFTEFTRIHVDRDPAMRAEMMQKSGRRTVPQIFIGDFHVGGYDDLAALDRAGRLDPLLRGEAA